MLQGMRRPGPEVKLIWVPTQRGIKDSDIVDKYARSAMRKQQISIPVTYSKA